MVSVALHEIEAKVPVSTSPMDMKGGIEDVGIGVTNVKVGDKVDRVWDWSWITLPNYTIDGKTISSGKVTTLSEFNYRRTLRRLIMTHLPSLLTGVVYYCLNVIDNKCDLKFGGHQSSGVEG